MAIKKDIIYKNITIENAYIKAEGFTGDKDNLKFYMRAYKDIESSNSLDNVLTSDELIFVPSNLEDSIRWDKQAYEYAKTLEKYADAIDC